MSVIPQEKYAWVQSAPGVWKRRVDEIESWYNTMATLYSGSGRTFFGMTGHASLQVSVPSGSSREETAAKVDAALSNAWLALRHKHPTIASQVEQNEETHELFKVYRQLNSTEEQQAYLAKTLVTVTDKGTGVDFANSDPPCPKIFTLFVVCPDSAQDVIQRDLVLRGPHDIIDGIGTLILFNNLITLAAEAHAQGPSYTAPSLDRSEIAALSPPYRVAANVPETLSEQQKARIAADAASKVPSDDIEMLSVPYTKGDVLPGKHQRAALFLSEEDTSAVIKACKGLGATVTHAFHASIPIALRDLQQRTSEGPERTVRYVNYILRNERSNCVAPYNTSDHPVGLYHSLPGRGLHVDLSTPAPTTLTSSSRKEEFAKTMAHMRDFYTSVKNDAEHAKLAPFIWAPNGPFPPAPSKDPRPVPPPREHPSASISSMGPIDGVIQSRNGVFEVFDPWVTGEELGNGLGFFLGTYRGKLCFSVAYNDAWHNREEVDGVLGVCKDIVFAGLGISA